MLEESITSSPQKPNRSIHKARIHRKNKRLRHDTTTTQNQEYSTTDEKYQQNVSSAVQELPSLADLYWEGNTKDNIPNLNTTFSVRRQFGAYFDPFEDELLLAVADRLDCAQNKGARSQFVNVETGNGFTSCSQLLEKLSATDQLTEVRISSLPLCKSPQINPIKIDKITDVQNSNIPVKKSPGVPISTGPKTQFGVTESELLQCCEIAERRKEVKNENLEEVLQTPQLKKHKSIVESILEDFCSSPASPDGRQEQASKAAADSTPTFHFKNQQIRTYASRRRVVFPICIYSDDLNSVKPPSRIEDDAISSCSSGLSVQEDFTQPLEHSVESVDLNNTKLCENLLNLSAYFTQHSVDVETPVDSSKEQISASEKKKNNEYSFKSKAVEINEIISEIITGSEKLGNFKRCYSSSQGSVDFYGFPSSQNEENINVPSASLDKNAYISGNSDAQQLQGIVSNIMHIRSCRSDNGEEDIALKLNDEIFSESEEWNDDCDFFKNFKTQDVFQKSDDIRKLQCQGLKLMSKTPKAMPNLANKYADSILADIDIEKGNHSSQETLLESDDFKSASMKAGKSEYKLSLYKNLIDADLGNIQLSEWPIDDHTTKDKSNIPFAKTEFKGFQTASNKIIKISKDAKLKAAQLLENLPDFPNEIMLNSAQLNDFQTSKQLKSENNSTTNDNINTSISKIEFKGFQTASNKYIKISDDSKLKAAKLLDNLSEFPEQKSECSKLNNTKKDNTLMPVEHVFVGFRTASRKPIQISEEATLKAENILSSLPEIPTSKSKIPIEDQLNDIQLSEWHLNEERETIGEKQVNILPLSAKRKLEPETCGTVEQNAKILCKSYTTNDGQRSPLTPRTENCLPKSASFSTLSENISVSQFAKSELIARKNLLSLRKRRKSKTVQEPNIRDVKDIVATTPLKAQCHVYKDLYTPNTPNINEFVDFIPDTSTPLTIKINGFKNIQQQQFKANEIDSDFQQIKWEECNESMGKSATTLNLNSNFSITSDSSNANVTSNAANPSPKQRIERLRMYGKPPPVSPILMSSKYNCRPSGLRRGRSMTKK